MVAERWRATWDQNLLLARDAESAGLDFLLSGARWKGYDGAGDFQTVNLESTAWACGVLGATERISVIATVHVPFVHPVYAAMQMATADHIGHRAVRGQHRLWMERRRVRDVRDAPARARRPLRVRR